MEIPVSKDGFFIRHTTIISLVVVTVLMAMAAGLFYFQDQASNRAKSWVLHTYEVTGHIQLLFNRIKDVELGQRGYIIGGDEKFLEPYYEALRDAVGEDAQSTKMEQHHSVGQELAILRNLLKDNPVQEQNVDELELDINQSLEYWALTIRERESKELGKSFDLQKGKALMDQIRRLVAIMMAEENGLLSARIKEAEISESRNNIVTFSGITIFYLLTLVSILFYHRKKKAANIVQQKLIYKLADSNTELERFAYVASHDMQEPLRMVTNFSALIAEEYSGRLDTDGQEYLNLIRQSSMRMQDMLSDLLEYARVGNDDSRFIVVDGAKELSHVLENLSVTIKEHKAVVTYDTLPEFKGNPVQFMRLLQNLIGNGMKYQPEDRIPEIHVGAEDMGDTWRFSVADNGIGIEEDYLVRVFEPFKRLHTWAQFKGTGIGLAICKKIVESHGGKIWATSKAGAGSVFYFTIPKMKEEAA